MKIIFIIVALFVVFSVVTIFASISCNPTMDDDMD